VFDYANGKDLGRVDGDNAKLPTEFSDNLLIEVTRM
jgi:hypothetical protein